MWASIGRYVAKYLLLPIIMQLVVDARKAILDWLNRRKLNKEVDRKIKEYEDADSRDENTDSFNNLP